MTSYLAARKALYRRMFRYLEHPLARAAMFSYLLNRLDNGQIRDVLDLLDNDPQHQGAAEHVRQPARKDPRR
jgi:hypothetical protein